MIFHASPIDIARLTTALLLRPSLMGQRGRDAQPSLLRGIAGLLVGVTGGRSINGEQDDDECIRIECSAAHEDSGRRLWSTVNRGANEFARSVDALPINPTVSALIEALPSDRSCEFEAYWVVSTVHLRADERAALTRLAVTLVMDPRAVDPLPFGARLTGVTGGGWFVSLSEETHEQRDSVIDRVAWPGLASVVAEARRAGISRVRLDADAPPTPHLAEYG